MNTKAKVYMTINDEGREELMESPSKAIRGYDYTGFTKSGAFFRIQREANTEEYKTYIIEKNGK